MPIRSVIKTLGPYRSMLWVLLVGLATLSASRLGLVIWQYERVSAVIELPVLFLQGMRADLIIMGLLLVPLALAMPFLANHPGWKLWRGLVLVWGVFAITLLVFMELSTPTFIQQYDVRPNRLFVEYLAYPKEVFAMLWEGFRLPLLLGLAFTVLACWAVTWLLRRHLTDCRADWPLWKLLLTWLILVPVLVLMIRSSLGHRPANPALFALTSDSLVNSLIINSAWSVAFAVYNLKHEENSSEIYGSLSSAEIMAELHAHYPWLRPDGDAPLPTLHGQQATRKRAKPLNLVIVLEESLGATFVESLGGIPVTTELERLKHEGWWFEQLYATGTRSVRGIEAVISGYPPTPARSVVKLSLSQEHFFTIAGLLGRKGYFTEFIYGGEAHFDNMASFFLGNGFQSIIDQRDYTNPVFKGSWGVSDEDLLNKTHQRILELHGKDQPFLVFAFSSSNHSPFEFPDGRIELHDPQKQTVNNAVKYADFALGQFFDNARNSDYWRDTLFMVVADHDIRVYGDSLVPIERFHIPGLILGADLEPKRIDSIASQIDLAPTLLSLMGIDSSHPMIGRDMSLPEQQQSPGRALMQFEDHFALMKDDRVTILRPGKPALAGHYDFDARRLEMAEEAGPADVQEALAHSLLPSWLYREQRYRLPE
ncbi:MAG: LTA synthase family protein [Porticoccaceae bacterium]